MALKAEDLFEKLKKGDILPVYFLTGEESYLRNAALDLLLSRTVDPASRDFNLSVFQGGDAEVDQIIGQAASYPMLSESRTVVIRNVNQMDSAALDVLAQYVSNAASTTVMILEGPALPAKSSLYREIKKNNAVFEFRALYENNVPRWIKSYVKRNGKTIEDGAVHFLVEIAGTDLQNLSNELDKLALFTGSGTVIKSTDVKYVCGASKLFNVFELQKALGSGDISRTLHILNRMLTEGESAAGIIVMISRYLSILWKLAMSKKDGVSKAELSKAVGVPVFFLNDYLAASGRYREAQLECAFEQLMYADLLIKRGAVNISLTVTIPLLALLKPGLFRSGWSPLLPRQLR